jgi:hypothetical protein
MTFCRVLKVYCVGLIEDRESREMPRLVFYCMMLSSRENAAKYKDLQDFILFLSLGSRLSFSNFGSWKVDARATTDANVSSDVT